MTEKCHFLKQQNFKNEKRIKIDMSFYKINDDSKVNRTTNFCQNDKSFVNNTPTKETSYWNRKHKRHVVNGLITVNKHKLKNDNRLFYLLGGTTIADSSWRKRDGRSDHADQKDRPVAIYHSVPYRSFMIWAVHSNQPSHNFN